MKKKYLYIIISTLLILTANVTPAFATTKDYTTTRIGNSDIFDTAVAIGKEFTKDNPTENCIICNPDNRLDDVSATPLSLYKNAPILLTNSKILNDKTKQALSDLGIKNVFLIGNTKYISKTVENQLVESGYRVTRLGGKDCFETNRIIMNYIPKDLWGPYPKIVNVNDWVQCLTVAVDVKYTYKWSEETPWNSDDFSSNYEDAKLPDGTIFSKRKYITKSKTLINPIFVVNNNVWKNKDFKYFKDTMHKINNWHYKNYYFDTDPLMSYDISRKVSDNIMKYSGEEYMKNIYKKELQKARKKNPNIRSIPNHIIDAVNKALNNFSSYIAVNYYELATSHAYGENKYNYSLDSNIAINQLYSNKALIKNANHRVPYNYQSVLLTRYNDFVDCLLSAPLSAKNHTPIVLINKSVKDMKNPYWNYTTNGIKVESPTIGYKNVNIVYYIGGEDGVLNNSESYLGN